MLTQAWAVSQQTLHVGCVKLSKNVLFVYLSELELNKTVGHTCGKFMMSNVLYTGAGQV